MCGERIETYAVLLEVSGGMANGIGQTTRLIPGRGHGSRPGDESFVFA